MGNLLNEIRQFRRFVNLKEEFSPIKTVLFGDELIYFLYDDDITIIKELSDKFLTMTDLINRLSSTEPDFSIDHVFFSIGTDDKFKNTNEIFILSKEIRRVFPKSRLNVIRAIIDESYFYSYEEDKVIDNLELEIDNFYNVFDKSNVKVIGTYNSVDYGGGISREKINNIKTEIAKSILDDVTDLDITSPINQNLDTEPFINVNNDVIGGDDETDFDTIYEFLDRFEEIYKSGNQYNRRTNQTHKLDIEQIQIALNFINGDDIEINGKYDLETEESVISYQSKRNLPETGICDQETLEELFYDLKVKGFEEEDLFKFLTTIGVIVGSLTDEIIDGVVDYSSAGLSSQQSNNIQIMIDYMNDEGITNPYTQIGILSCIGKESGFMPQNEVCYNNTSNSRIREVFGSCRLGKYNDDELTELKKDCVEFFDAVYGPDATSCLGWNTGNTEKGDGYKYRGRGFNGITFKSTYSKYSSLLGQDFVSNPDSLNDVDNSAMTAVAFFTNGKTPPDFTDKKSATDYFVNKNAGGSSSWQESFDNAYTWMDKFDIKPKNS
jgi:predicted chitinase